MTFYYECSDSGGTENIKRTCCRQLSSCTLDETNEGGPLHNVATNTQLIEMDAVSPSYNCCRCQCHGSSSASSTAGGERSSSPSALSQSAIAIKAAAPNFCRKVRDFVSARTGGRFFRKEKCNENFEEQEVELIKDVKNETVGCGRSKVSIGISSEESSSQFRDYLNYGEEDQMEIEGYTRSSYKTVFTWMSIICTAGLLRLVFHWWPQLMLYATHRRSPISKAEKILVIEDYQQKCKRYHVKAVFTLSADLFRTTKLFAAAGLPPDQIHESSNTWDQRLEQELRSIDSPKLAIPKSDGNIREAHSVRLFTCKKLRYVWDDQFGAFVKLQGFDHALTQALHLNAGLSIFQQCQRRLIYGSNEIPVVVQGILKLLFLEVLNPFYVFQIFSVSLWLSDGYIYFSFAIIIMSVFGITSTIIQTRQNQKKLQTTVQSSDITTVSRGGGVYDSIPTEYLVPGDVIVIPPQGCTLHCDAALLSGNCIVNESMLTGESVPVTKTPLPNREDVTYNSKEHMRHTLYCGTNILQTRHYGQQVVLAVVLRTGFLTAKGSLVRSILYPPPVDYKFERDSYKFVTVLALIAFVGFVFSVFTKLSLGQSYRDIIVDSLDLITIVVPPALPAAMTVGRLYAQRRLQQKGIYCISPRAINVSGSINCVCFDKTGTLTEEGLDLWGAVPTTAGLGLTGGTSGEFQTPVRFSSHLSHGPLFIGMAACHSLTLIDDNLIGDPLDLKMFEWTEWILEEPGVADSEKFDVIGPTIVRTPSTEVNDNVPVKNANFDGEKENVVAEVGIVRQFPFSSSLQRMSVITRTLGGCDFELFCKGSPEMITSLSLPQSVPYNFHPVLERYTQQGYRVIAIAHKQLPKQNYAKRMTREEVEFDLTFLGLIVLENRLKPESTDVIRVLKKADIRTIMVTGDNMLTAISVARECCMMSSSEKVVVIGTDADSVGVSKDSKIPKLSFYLANNAESTMDMTGPGSRLSIESENNVSIEGNLFDVESPVNRYHFAVSGNSFAAVKAHYPELLSKILVRGTVFARMSPDQKQQLVEQLQALGYFVGMCGDGANDCGALKAAHAGVSLSEAESSVASPFTSKEANITCVPNLIREGRAALVTSFGIFKYMAVYSLTQFSSVIILYTIASNLSDIQFLYIDLFLISVFALFFGHTEPFDGPLVKQPPSASLVSLPPVFSILFHMSTIIAIQNIAFSYVYQQSWFTPYVEKEDQFASYENYTLFAVSTFQYIIMAIVFSQGAPYRKSLVTNPRLLISLAIMTSFTIYLVLWPCSWLITRFDLLLPPDFNFRLKLLGFPFANLIIALLIEYFLVNFILARKLNFNFQWRKKVGDKSKNAYLEIEEELSKRTDWPSMTSSPNFSVSNTPALESPSGLGGEDLKRKSRLSTSAFSSSLLSKSITDEQCRKTARLSIPIPLTDYSDPKSQNSRSRSQSLAFGENVAHITDRINNHLNSTLDPEKEAHLEIEMIQHYHQDQGHP